MTTPTRADRWAPWWAYVVPIVGINYLRIWLIPFGTLPEVVDALLAIVIAVALFVAITAAYRVAVGDKKGP